MLLKNLSARSGQQGRHRNSARGHRASSVSPLFLSILCHCAASRCHGQKNVNKNESTVTVTAANLKVREFNSAVKREATAALILDIIAGTPLKDHCLERGVRDAMYVLPAVTSPTAWRKLQRDAALFGRQPIREALGKDAFEVPDIRNSTESRCQLTASLEGQRFANEVLNTFMADLFSAIPAGFKSLLLPTVTLSRFDLFHAHMFLGRNSQEVGLLFHAQEYPAMQEGVFPYNLGYCQRNSTLGFCQAAMDLRNILWYQGKLVALDVGESSVLYGALLMDGVQEVRTVYEGDFGQRVFDLNFFDELQEREPRDRLFIC